MVQGEVEVTLNDTLALEIARAGGSPAARGRGGRYQRHLRGRPHGTQAPVRARHRQADRHDPLRPARARARQPDRGQRQRDQRQRQQAVGAARAGDRRGGRSPMFTESGSDRTPRRLRRLPGLRWFRRGCAVGSWERRTARAGSSRPPQSRRRARPREAAQGSAGDAKVAARTLPCRRPEGCGVSGKKPTLNDHRVEPVAHRTWRAERDYLFLMRVDGGSRAAVGAAQRMRR